MMLYATVSHNQWDMCNIGIVEFNVPLDTLQVISEMFYGSHDPTNSAIALKDDG